MKQFNQNLFGYKLPSILLFIKEKMQKNMVKTIALYGGAFDPPHIGHIAIIESLLSISFVTEVWLLPSGDRTDKKMLLSKDQRFQLLESIIKKKQLVGKIHICDQQIILSKQRKRMIPTIQLLQHFEAKYASFDFHFVIGSDILSTIHLWQKHQQLISSKKFIIFPRKGYEQNNAILMKTKDLGLQNETKLSIPSTFYFNNFTAPQISSSYIKSTLLNEKLSREEKRQRLAQFIEELTLSLLQKNNMI